MKMTIKKKIKNISLLIMKLNLFTNIKKGNLNKNKHCKVIKLEINNLC